ncbi:MAG: thioredoxin domain-containing protein, partial [Candidatus Thorarchaeota archaeon]
RGGWPLTIIMTPDKKPFYAGTYIPKKGRYNMPGMLDLIPQIKKIWESDRSNIDEIIQNIETALANTSGEAVGEAITEDALRSAFNQLSQRFDEKLGGFGSAPKFPSPHNLMLLLRIWNRYDDPWALRMVETTLEEMRKGGLFDQVGYGFHRYSTDANWLLPHFEKMLYDQAGLMMTYTEAYQATKKPRYADVVKEIFTYLTRDLMSSEGSFYSAEDADSEGVEGKFYVWSYEEIKRLLTEKEKEVFTKFYKIEPKGNFLEEATREETGLNIPHITSSAEDIANEFSLEFNEFLEIVESARMKIFTEREKRIRPHRDEKILTDWNGFMIAALAKAGAALNEIDLVNAAEQAMKFLLEKLMNEKGELYHRYSDGEVAHRAFLDDYAYIIYGLLELYEATFEPRYLERAKQLTDDMLLHFLDVEKGGLFFTADYSEELLVRRKDSYDGAMPSGNSIAMLNLIRLARLLGDSKYEDHANSIGKAFSSDINRAHSAFSMMLVGLDFAIGPSFEIVIAGKPENDDTREMLDQIRKKFIPRKIVLLRGTENQTRSITELAPFTKYHEPVQGKATAHVCVDQNCKLPTTDLVMMMKLIGEELH